VISFDTETWPIYRPIVAPPPVCMQYCVRRPKHNTDAELHLFTEAHVADLFRECANGVTIYGHNVAYDMGVVMAACPDLIPLVFSLYEHDLVQDTLLNQKLIDIAHGELEHRKMKGYALDIVAARYDLVVDKEDPWRLKYKTLANIPVEDWPKDARDYALRDATVTWQIATAQQAVCADWEAKHGSPILHQGPARARADLALFLAKAWGCRTSQPQCAKLEEVTHNEIERMKAILIDAKLVRPSGSKDTKAAKARVIKVFDELNKELRTEGEQEIPIPLSKTGQISCERDTMIQAGDEILITYSEYTTASNLMNRVQDLKKGIWLPLQPRYDSLLETGRTSSSKGTKKNDKPYPGRIEGIQIQNFPRALSKLTKQALLELGYARVIGHDKRTGEPRIHTTVGARECIVPRPGNVFVLADYSSAELHTLAQCHIDMFGQSRLAEILNNGDDVHLMVGVGTYSKGEFEYSKALKKQKNQDPFAGWRQAAKPIVFGRPGGMGARKIVVTARKSYEVILTLSEAQDTINTFEALVPELPMQFELVNGIMGGRQRGLMRQLRSGRWRGGATYCAINNSFFQGLAADGALAAGFWIAYECYSDKSSPLYGYRIVAFVHDEWVLEGPEERCHEAALRLQLIMEREMNVFTPDCPTPAEPVVTRVWTKGAEAVKNERGLYVPYRMAA